MDLIVFLFVSVALNLAMFVPAFLFKTDRFTDISYALTFILLAGLAFLRSPQTTLQTILLIAICVWAVRLGGFLLFRIWRIKRDKRFDGMRESFPKFLRFWLLQGISVFIILIASFLAFGQNDTSINAFSWIGLAIFVIGLTLEATADIQKYRFNANPNNKNKWIDIGAWSKSRHPNYLGEMMVWIGLYLFVMQSLGSSDKLIGLISPAYIIALLLFVSGIPLLEKAADARWGKDKDYQAYKKRTPVLLPLKFN